MKEQLQSHLLRAMADPAFYPHKVSKITRCETHISVVFLTGDYAYKIKKAVDFGFLNFSTLEKRRHYCEREILLNRRLSSDIYLGAIALTHDGRKFSINGAGEIVEWAVQMRQLPSNCTLKHLLADHAVSNAHIQHLASRLAEFHRSARSFNQLPTWSYVKAACDENFRQVEPCKGYFIDGSRLGFIRDAVNDRLDRLQRVFEQRTRSGHVRDGHGDLRAEHVYFTGQGEMQILDCIEFNDRLRTVDVASDLAFLSMDLDYLDEPRLSRLLVGSYCGTSGDATLLSLMDFYKCYRAMVRCKVSCIHLSQPELNKSDLKRLAADANQYLNLAHRYARRMTTPMIWVFCGLPGSGKSTVSAKLSEALDIPALNSDQIRKKMFGKAPRETRSNAIDQGIYRVEISHQVYEALLNWARAHVESGRSVILDATFGRSANRQKVLHLADRCGAQALFVECSAPEAALLNRLKERESTGSISDARPAHFRALKSRFEPLSEIPAGRHMHLDTTAPLKECLNRLFIKRYLNRMKEG